MGWSWVEPYLVQSLGLLSGQVLHGITSVVWLIRSGSRAGLSSTPFVEDEQHKGGDNEEEDRPPGFTVEYALLSNETDFSLDK